MPTHEFRCDDCRDIFEERRTMAAADDPAGWTVICPKVRLIDLFYAQTSNNRH